jgi:hypothetical protein
MASAMMTDNHTGEVEGSTRTRHPNNPDSPVFALSAVAVAAALLLVDGRLDDQSANLESGQNKSIRAGDGVLSPTVSVAAASGYDCSGCEASSRLKYSPL